MLKIGKGKKLESRVIFGEQPSRKIKDLDLIVGKNAFIRSGSILYLGSQIGNSLQTGHNVIIREENDIGDDFSIWSNSIIDYGCKIGNRVKIHCNCYIAQYTTIEDDVFMAPGVIVANDLHPGTPDAMGCMKGPTIRKGTQIGCNATILPHITIGEYVLVGAGSVLTKDIPSHTIVYGNPAKVVKKITDYRCKILHNNPYDFLLGENKVS